MHTLELALQQELEVCSEIIKEGREFQKEQGFVQWTDDYPSKETIQSDIESGTGYIVKADGQIAGYLCIDFSGEPAYEAIEGKWKSDGPYAVVHRMAFSKNFRGTGLSDITFRLTEELCARRQVHSIKVDTDFQNERMQHILKKNGFEQCGIIVFQGSGKLAFEKLF